MLLQPSVTTFLWGSQHQDRRYGPAADQEDSTYFLPLFLRRLVFAALTPSVLAAVGGLLPCGRRNIFRCDAPLSPRIIKFSLIRLRNIFISVNVKRFRMDLLCII
jgi:hypothetical protein